MKGSCDPDPHWSHDGRRLNVARTRVVLDTDRVDGDAVRATREYIGARRIGAAKRRRLRRNLVILAAARAGLSQRLIADVLGLSRAAVWEVIRGESQRGKPSALR